MKWFFYLFFTMCLWLILSCSVAHKEDKIVKISGYRWHTNIDNALLLAKKEHKDMIVMVSEKSCRWCVKMEQRTLVDSRVRKKLKKYILVSVKRSDKKSLKHIPMFDGSIPSFFFLEPDSDFIEAIVGYYEAGTFLEYMNEIEDDAE